MADLDVHLHGPAGHVLTARRDLTRLFGRGGRPVERQRGVDGGAGAAVGRSARGRRAAGDGEQGCKPDVAHHCGMIRMIWPVLCRTMYSSPSESCPKEAMSPPAREGW